MKRFPVVIAVAVLFLNGACRDRSRRQTSMEISVEQEQAIRILRDAYAASNRGGIAAAVAQLDRLTGPNLRSSPAVVLTTDAMTWQVT
jgi:hypothetical protein